MTDLLAAAAARLGSPEHLVERSAAARAEADGLTTEEVLAAWAGGVTVSSDRTPEAPPASEPDTPPAESTQPLPEPDTPTVPAPVADGPLAVAATGTTPAPAPPERVGIAEALDFEAVTTGHTAGITERVAASLPRWLTSLFFAVPLAGLVYLITFSGGPTCGSGGQLAVDRLTGLVENCDGSEFSAGGGAGGVDVRSLVAEGVAVYNEPSSCASCHGAGGEGGSGPALAGSILDTFAMCTDHIEWVSLGTTGFQAAGRASYGDTGKAVGGGGQMPSFQDTLTAEQITATVFYERVVFGGQAVEEAVFDCGFAEPEGEGAESDVEAPAGQTEEVALGE